MKYLKISLAAILALAFAQVSFAQDSDEIVLTAVFAEAIDLNVTGGANLTFTVNDLNEYTNGLADSANQTATFEVSSSVDFKVDLEASTFVGQNTGGNLNPANFIYKVADAGTYDAGTNHRLVGNATTSPSNWQVLGTSATTIVSAYSNGNAGPASANTFKVTFELGTATARSLSELSTLLEQNIAPDSYVSTVTLTASAMP